MNHLYFVLLILFKVKPERKNFRSYGKSIASRDKNGLYEKLIKSYDPLLNIYISKNSKEVEFINTENGRGSGLHSYRKIKSNNLDLFEKIYFKGRPEWERVKAFELIYHDLVTNGISAPRVISIDEGGELGVIYSEYLYLEPPDENKIFTTAMNRSKDLVKISLSNPKILKERFSNYDSEKIFSEGFRQLEFMTQNDENLKDLDLNAVNDWVAGTSARFLNHGDLKKGNIFKNNVLIDWDKFGYYPIGYDAGYTLGVFQKDINLTFEKYLEIEKSYYEDIADYVNKYMFEISFSFFTAVFMCWNKTLNKDCTREIAQLLMNRFKTIKTTY